MRFTVTPPTSPSTVITAVRAIISRLTASAGRIPLLSALIDVVAPSAANTAFTVSHDLGFVPDDIIVPAQSGQFSVYATTQDRTAWTTTGVVIRCSSASVRLRLYALTLGGTN